GLLTEHRLRLDLQIDFLAHEEAAGLQGDVPRDAPVLTINLGAGGEADPEAAPRIDARALVLGVQDHGARDVTDGEIAGDPKLVAADPLHLRGPERDRGVRLDLEEVGRTEVRVSLIDARGEALDLHGGLGRG